MACARTAWRPLIDPLGCIDDRASPRTGPLSLSVYGIGVTIGAGIYALTGEIALKRRGEARDHPYFTAPSWAPWIGLAISLALFVVSVIGLFA